uniref:Uncharacterized protein n=1 Tax=Anguilla anguilla TaxID=7936 RepID=A0A0E9PE49_ANGAN
MKTAVFMLTAFRQHRSSVAVCESGNR